MFKRKKPIPGLPQTLAAACCGPLAASDLHGKGDKVALHARRDVEAAGSGVHGRGVLAVLDLLQQDLLLVIPAVRYAGMCV